MSTKAIREALESVRWDEHGGSETPAYTAAIAELAAIEKAAATLDRLHVGDFIYNIRDMAAGDAEYKGDTWFHPDVKAWSDAAQTMKSIAKEIK